MTGLGKDNMEDQSTVGMTEEGANYQEDIASTPPSEDSPNSDNLEAAEEHAEEESQDSRFDKHPRFQKMQRQIRKLRNIEREYQNYQSSYGQAIKFHNWLTENPHLIPKIQKALEEERQASQQAEDDPFADLDPRLAQEFREMKSVLAAQKQAEQHRAQEMVTTHQSNIDEHFKSLLASDGISDPKRDEELMNYHSVFVRALLDEAAKDKDRPTVKEVNEAYAYSKAVIQKLANRSLSKLTKNAPHAPPSGSKRGSSVQGSPPTKAYSNDEIAQLLTRRN